MPKDFTLADLTRDVSAFGVLSREDSDLTCSALSALAENDQSKPLIRRARAVALDLRAQGHVKSARALAQILRSYSGITPNNKTSISFRKQNFSSVAEYEAKFGPLPDSFNDVATLDFAKNRAPDDQAFEKRYADLLAARADTQTDEDRRKFIDRLKIGFAMFQVIMLLVQNGSRELRELKRSGETPNTSQKRALKLTKELESKIKIKGLEAVKAYETENRSVLMLCAHQGFHRLARHALKDVKLPRMLVSKQGGGNNQSDTVFKADNSDPTSFIRFLRKFKKEPHLLEIYPDGHQGSVSEQKVLGFPVKMGTGFLAIGWQAKAAIFHCVVLWDGSTFTIEFIPGLDPKGYEDGETFQRDLMASYVATIEAHYSAEPENIRLMQVR